MANNEWSDFEVEDDELTQLESNGLEPLSHSLVQTIQTTTEKMSEISDGNVQHKPKEIYRNSDINSVEIETQSEHVCMHSEIKVIQQQTTDTEQMQSGSDEISNIIEINSLNIEAKRHDQIVHQEKENILGNLENNDLNLQARREELNMQPENDNILENLETTDLNMKVQSEDITFNQKTTLRET